MKTIVIGLLLLCFAGSTFALDKAELDNRVRKLTAKFEAMQQKPDKAIPAENLRKAQGIVLLDRTKAGFIFAFQGGSGVAMVKDPKTEKWSPAAWVGASEASLGFQIGGQQSFIVILLMTTNSTHMLTESTADFGGEASGTADTKSSGVEGTVSSAQNSIMVYADRKGLYGGATIKGGVIAPDTEANLVYYGKPLSMQDILFDKKVEPTEGATKLITRVTEHSKVAQK